METIPLLLAAYLIGSIPFGLILTRLAGLGDIRSIGSGNIGATNVLRTGNKKLAALTLLLDGFKGFFAVWLYRHLAPAELASAWAALFALLGHCFPLWLKFKGGKGVATTYGVWLGLSWVIGLVALLLWLLTAWIGKRSSLAALVSITVTLLLMIATELFNCWPVPGEEPVCIAPNLLALIPHLAIWLVVTFRHKDNIKRLVADTEPKIGQKKTC